MTHPLRLWLKSQPDTTIKDACEKLAKAATDRGTPVGPAMVRAISDGKRRPKPPLSTTIANLTGIDEMALLKWERKPSASVARRVA